MNTYITKIQNALLEYINNNKYGKALLSYSAVFVYAFLVYELLDFFRLGSAIYSFLNWFSAIFYFVYLAGLVMSFAKKDSLAILIAFAYKSLAGILSIIFGWGFTFNRLVNICAYGFLAYIVFSKLYLNANASAVAYNTPVNAAPQKKFCPGCGAEMSAESTFCANCGTKVQ